jgi:hypothetical protein
LSALPPLNTELQMYNPLSNWVALGKIPYRKLYTFNLFNHKAILKNNL